MITITVSDAAGPTRGRPQFEGRPWGNTYSDGGITQDTRLPPGSAFGYVTEGAEGSFDIYYPWSRSRVTAYTIDAGDDYSTMQRIYTETYDRPLIVRGEPKISKVLAAADRYADAGIDFTGNAHANVFAGERGNDSLAGLGGRDRLAGNSGRDALDGGGGDDRLDGGLGRDRLTGGAGSDRFVFGSEAEAGGGNGRPADRVLDLDPDADLIDVRRIDAHADTLADDAFRFIGDREFTGRAGQLRFDDDLLSGDTDGDGAADFAISIDNGALPTADTLLL